ncbi:unnamed protein product [Adineta ricciae]|uniref:Uncharacterized protein n=1 Tax=Adineta ricciae TaxID=249248 RepID=A0A813XEK4_ADIRI|nr:unnamed protein product [Adineta ricciae]
MAENQKSSTSSVRLGYLSGRKQRIECWASRRTTPTQHSTASAATALLGTASAQKRSESSYKQTNRLLNVQLLQLGMERQNTIDQRTFEQKGFINRQTLRHKHNQAMIDILNYVRQCCKYADTHESQGSHSSSSEQTKRTKRSLSKSSSFTRSPPAKRSLSASPYVQAAAALNQDENVMIETNEPRLTTENTVAEPLIASEIPVNDDDDDAQKRRVQFQMNTDSSEVQPTSLLLDSSTNDEIKPKQRTIISAPITLSINSLHKGRSINSAPFTRTVSSVPTSSLSRSSQSLVPKRPPSRFIVSKSSLRDFRLHPEKYLSPSNCYLPLLRRQSIETKTNERLPRQSTNLSRSTTGLSLELDAPFDDAKSFLSDDDTGKPIVHPQLSSSNERERRHMNVPLPKRANPINNSANIPESHTATMARLRQREYTRLNNLVRSKLIEKVIAPLSTVKNDDCDEQSVKQDSILHDRQSSFRPARARQLADILRSIDSLNCADSVENRARREMDIEKNRAKLSILIF